MYPIPTFLLKYSLPSEVFPSYFKHAHVNSLLKKPSLPANNLNSYRPIFNLYFISLVLKKVLSSHLNVHLNCNHLCNIFLSAYNQLHSTETILLKVHDSISLNIDTGKVTALILLVIFSAFYTISYSQHSLGSTHS